MDWYPLWNSLRIASISCAIVFFLGILAAYYVARLPRAIKGILDVIFTLPMVLAAYGLRVFSADPAGPQEASGDLSGQIRPAVCHDLVRRDRGFGDGGFSPDVPDGPGGLLRALTRIWPTPARLWDFPIRIFSGGSACLPAGRGSWRGPCWLLPEL